VATRHGKVFQSGVYGLRDIESKTPFTPRTLCWIASITKPVTVAAAYRAACRKIFQADGSIRLIWIDSHRHHLYNTGHTKSIATPSHGCRRSWRRTLCNILKKQRCCASRGIG
jgi:hypothetical protein